MAKVVNIVFTAFLVTMASAFINGASIMDPRSESNGDSTIAKDTTSAIVAAQQVDTAISDLTTLEKSLRNDKATEFVSLRRQALLTVRFLNENREAVILRLQSEPDNGLGLVNLLARIDLPTEEVSEEVVPTPSFDAIQEQLRIFEHMDALRTSNSAENEIEFL